MTFVENSPLPFCRRSDSRLFPRDPFMTFVENPPPACLQAKRTRKVLLVSPGQSSNWFCGEYDEVREKIVFDDGFRGRVVRSGD